MKNKIIGIIVLTIIIGVSFVSCGSGGSSGHKDYIGTWSRTGLNDETITISTNELTFKNDRFETGYVMSIDSITPMKDEDDQNYTNGIRFDGKIKELIGDSVYTLGYEMKLTLWMHTGKKELITGSNKTPYKKQ